VALAAKHSDRACALRKTKPSHLHPAERLARRKARESAQQKEKIKGDFGTVGFKRRFRAFFAEKKGTRTAVRNIAKKRRFLCRTKKQAGDRSPARLRFSLYYFAM